MDATETFWDEDFFPFFNDFRFFFQYVVALWSWKTSFLIRRQHTEKKTKTIEKKLFIESHVDDTALKNRQEMLLRNHIFWKWKTTIDQFQRSGYNIKDRKCRTSTREKWQIWKVRRQYWKKSKPIKEEFTEMKNILNNLEQEQELLGMSHRQQGKPS